MRFAVAMEMDWKKLENMGALNMIRIIIGTSGVNQVEMRIHWAFYRKPKCIP